jgi:hypothetical protein
MRAMKKLAMGLLFVGLLVACGGEDKKVMVVPVDAQMTCNPLLNTGCPAQQKCTWLLDALMPNYVGHIGCAPEGAVAVGGACMYGAPGETGYDDCVGGSVCSNFRGTAPGVCKSICDQQGGTPACDSTHVCVVYSNLFDLGETTPAAAGVCNVACNPLTDNDYDGVQTAFDKTGTTCGSAAEGCYGSPSGGTAPPSGWACTRDIHYGSATHYGHRVNCVEANGCADPGPRVYQNSCNQGYLPLLIESTGSTTTICVAFCQPDNCFMGTCGTNNLARQGKMPNRCNPTDRLGNFLDGENPMASPGTTTPAMYETGGEHCQYMWNFEIDNATGTFLPSPSSDTLGFCFAHHKYKYDSDMDNMRDAEYPGCQLLADGISMATDPSMPLAYFGATELGCTDSTRLQTMPAVGKLEMGKPVQLPSSFMEKFNKIERPRMLYDRRVYEP